MTEASAPELGYLDTSALMRWVERDIDNPRELNVRVGAAVEELMGSALRLGLSELTLIEFRSAVAQDWRREDAQCLDLDTEWAERARTALMTQVAEGTIQMVPVSPKAYEHAITLVDMAAFDHKLPLGAWDAIHLITACAWAHREKARVRLFTTDDDYEDFVAVYPHFRTLAEVVNLDTTTASS
jgi:hypothetical protein